MSVIMAFIFGFVRNTHKNQHNNICKKIGQRMKGIRYHRSAVSKYATCKLNHYQHEIYNASDNGYFIYTLLSFFIRYYFQ